MPFNNKIQNTPLDEAVGSEITRQADHTARKLTVLECHQNGIQIHNINGPGYTDRARVIYNRHLQQTLHELYEMVNEIQEIIEEVK